MTTRSTAGTLAQMANPEPILRPNAIRLRPITQVFSRAAIAEVCCGGFDGRAAKALQELSMSGAISKTSSRRNAIAALSAWLMQNYRSEHIFKSAIANKLLFGRYKPTTTALLQEFRVGRSKVDSVIVNGSVKAFEIKTELDSPQKLAKQIADYRTVFPLISVVTDESISHRYEELLKDTPVGVIALTRRDGSLSERKGAELDVDGLSIQAMMRTLRKPEYTAVVERATGGIPKVPNTMYFTTCLDEVSALDRGYVHALWADELRKRKLRAPSALLDEALRPLRHVCVQINPDEAQAANLNKWLAGAVA